MISKLFRFSVLLASWIFTSYEVSGQSDYTVTYTLPIIQSASSDDTLYKSTVTYNIWESVLKEIIVSAQKGMFTIYDTSGNPTTIDKIIDKSKSVDTILLFNSQTLKEEPHRVFSSLQAEYLSNYISGFGMTEKWKMRDDGMIEKKIDKLAFLHYTRNNPQSILFLLYPKTVALKHEVATVEYNIDLSHFDNKRDSVAFVAEIMKILLAGKAKVYEPFGKKYALSVKEIEETFKPQMWTEMITKKDSLMKDKPVFKTGLKQNKICAIKFREQWRIDAYGNIEKLVKEYRLMTADYDRNGVYRGMIAFLVVKNERE